MKNTWELYISRKNFGASIAYFDNDKNLNNYLAIFFNNADVERIFEGKIVEVGDIQYSLFKVGRV